MLFYWGLWAFFLFLSLTWKDKNYAQSYKLLYGIIVVLAILTGGREYVGTDWASYKNYYETGIAEDKTSGHMELIFELLRNICHGMGLSYGMFCFILCLISLLVLLKSQKILGVRNCFLSFWVYLSLFFCNYQFNIVRHGLLASFVMLAMAYLSIGEKRKSLICVLISSGFHMMGFLFIPFIFFMDKPLSKKWLSIIVAISLFVFAVDLSGRIIAAFPFLALIDRVEGYVDADRNEVYKLSIGIVGFFLIALYSHLGLRKLYDENKGFRIMANMLLGGFVVFCTLNGFSSLVQRIGNLLNLSVVILLPYIWSNSRTKRHVVSMLLVIYLGLYYPKSWNVADEEGNYSMLPFKTDITNLL